MKAIFLSACHKERVKVTGDGTTMHYVCTKCKKECDVIVKEKPLENLE